MRVAAPIHGHNGDIIGAISVTFPKYIHEERGIETEIEVVKRYAAAISVGRHLEFLRSGTRMNHEEHEGHEDMDESVMETLFVSLSWFE